MLGGRERGVEWGRYSRVTVGAVSRSRPGSSVDSET